MFPFLVPYGMNILSAIVLNIFEYMFELKPVQLKCTLNIVLFFFRVFFSLMQALPIDKKGSSDKRYTVVHHLGYKAYHQAHNIRHILATWCCMRKYIPYGNILSAQRMPRTLKMQTQLLTHDKRFCRSWALLM